VGTPAGLDIGERGQSPPVAGDLLLSQLADRLGGRQLDGGDLQPAVTIADAPIDELRDC
jgi:hypothetical protein